MPSLIKQLADQQIIRPPSFLASNVMYETYMGSYAYGVSGSASDQDVYGFAVPPKDMIFPHLAGEIPGFGRQIQRFDQYQQHHIQNGDDQYDLTIYNIVKYFQLCMENNPNILDSLFTPTHCVIHSTAIGNLVRENRKLFLHKGCFQKFKGYAFSQLSKAQTRKPQGKRAEIVEKYGVDTKFLYHVARLCDECEQILSLGDLDLTRSKEYMKAIRKGEVSLEDLKKWFTEKERQLEQLYHSSTLQYSPDEEKIKSLLLECLEMHYGSLDKCYIEPDKTTKVLRDIRTLIEKNSHLL